ncbi:response regulator [Pedobacter kyungheensis]|uniref:response regulator n=1 Tax=Pedobacter kyungheensis TaxID=1069985 RepID=UPI00068FF775|nr:response regulator [Pedobacter kyungheensis]
MERKKILIVEDDLILLETLTGILSSNGYECRGCEEAEKVTALAEHFRPDLFIIDYMLPEWNGGELCGAIRGLEGFAQTPIIITSAYTSIVLSLADYGCDAVLEKPFSIDELLKLISSLLSAGSPDSGLIPKVKMIIKNIIPKH